MARFLVTAVALLALSTPPLAAAQEARWTASQVVAPQGRSLLSAFPDGTAFAHHTSSAPVSSGAAGSGGSLFRSRDFGATWEGLTPPETNATASVRFATPQRGYTIGNSLVFRSDDAGSTWKSLPGPSMPSGTFLLMDPSLAAHGESVMFGGQPVGATTEDFTSSCRTPARIYSSHDGGRSWISAALPYKGAITTSIEMLDERNAVALAYDFAYDGECAGKSTRNLLFVTSDGGTSWRQALDCGEYCTSVAMVDPDRIVVGFNDGRIARSADAGRTFKEVTPSGGLAPPPGLERAFWISGLDFADCEVGYAGSNGRGTFRTDDGGLTWKPEISAQSVFGVGIGHLSVADRMHAIAGGPNALVHRTPGEGERAHGTDKPCPARPTPQAPPATATAPAPSATMPPSSVPKSQLRVRVSPARIRTGRRTRVTVQVSAGKTAVAGALVRVGRQSRTTDSRGRASFTVRLTKRNRQLLVRVQHPSHGVRSVVVRARRR